MKERERILDLVKQGILSTEEALDLLENSAKKETRESVKKDYSQSDYSEDSFSNKEETNESGTQESEKENKQTILENKMEELSNEVTAHSVKLDRLDHQLEDVQKTLDEKEKELIHLQTMEDLESMEEDSSAKIASLEESIHILQEKKNVLQEEKQKTIKSLQSIKMKQWSTQARKLKEQIDVPENWKESASDVFNQLGESMSMVGSEVSKTVKKTMDMVSENVDWTDMNIKVPSLVSVKLKHDFVYPESSATILDIKIANGNVTFKPSDSKDLKIEADVKIYGKLDGQSPMDAFKERSSIEEDEEKLKFHVANKRIRCNIVVHLPKKEYDYTAIHLLNGGVMMDGYKGKDVYVKNTNGDLVFKNIDAVMLETKGTNGKVTIKESVIRDSLIHTINGDLILQGELDNTSASTVNGTVRATLAGSKSTRLDVSSVNGMVKIAIPFEMDVEGEAQTNFGKIYSRLTDEEILSEKNDTTNKSRRFRRVREGSPLKLDATSTTGNILMKDSGEPKK